MILMSWAGKRACISLEVDEVGENVIKEWAGTIELEDGWLVVIGVEDVKRGLTTDDRASDMHLPNETIDLVNVTLEQDASAVGDRGADIHVAGGRQAPQRHQVRDVEQPGDEDTDIRWEGRDESGQRKWAVEHDAVDEEEGMAKRVGRSCGGTGLRRGWQSRERGGKQGGRAAPNLRLAATGLQRE